MLVDLGKAYYEAGEHSKAITALQRVHSVDSQNLVGMDVLASLLCAEKRSKELESLSTRLMNDYPEASQSWLAIGYLCLAQMKPQKALYFAHKAIGCGSQPEQRLEGMLLKGRVLLDKKRWPDAVQHLQEALRLDGHRFEIYESLVGAFLEQNKTREAHRAASMCRSQLGEQNPRAAALYASVLAREGTLTEAVAVLEKAIRKAPYLLNVVYLLVELYEKRGEFEKAVNLLHKQADVT